MLVLAAARPGRRRRPRPDDRRRPVADPGRHARAKGSGPEKLPFTPDTIREVVARQAAADPGLLRETLAGQDKPVEGKLMTHFVITPDGHGEAAPKVVKKGTTLEGRRRCTGCVVAVLSTMVFPKPPDGKDHPVEYPFNLKAVH